MNYIVTLYTEDREYIYPAHASNGNEAYQLAEEIHYKKGRDKITAQSLYCYQGKKRELNPRLRTE